MSARFVTAGWLAEHLDQPDVVVVDGSWYLPAMQRDPAAEFLAGHIPGAVRIDIETVRDTGSALPHMLPGPAEFAAAMGDLGIAEDMTIVVYDGAGLFSAPRVWWMLTVFGARDVRILDGGYPAWLSGGHPVERGGPRPRPARRFTAQLDAAMVADVADVQRALDTGAAQVLDARSAERFRGEAPEPRPGLRSGHLPGSRNMPYGEVVRDGRLADPATITSAVRAAGVDPARPVITSCGSGVTAAILWLALDAIGHP
ncbi:MAG TPA: 3-mercaptopyruvate sulfurtransferase, partial [Pseudonocardia sp.]|nr:3-mercaptopyruvate sulfurtransferase [Pseudonocardia sp.]